MFQQVQFPEWSSVVALAAFFVSSGIFLAIVVATLRSPRRKMRHMAELPLGKEKIS